jgi:integrase
MTKFNAENERLKRRYLEWEKEANGKSNSTVRNIQNYLYLYEEYTCFKDFKLFNKNDAIGFKKHLGQKKALRTRSLVSKAYLLHAARSLNAFFKWLSGQQGYRRAIPLSNIAYFSLQAKDIQAARASKSKRYPTLEQIEHVVKCMATETDIQKRDRALIAFFAISGARIQAVASFKIKHISLVEGRIEQYPDEVKTKNSKLIITYFFPVGELLTQVFIDWVNFLKKEKLFDDESPLFPCTKLSLNTNDKFSRTQLDTTAWKSTTSLRKIVAAAFQQAGLGYYNPHSFRDTIAQLGYRFCKTPEEFKAWSQNIGHNNPLTTFTSYGTVDEHRQGEIIKTLDKNKGDTISLTQQDFYRFKDFLKQHS